ncbi:MAG: hypothetical protein FH748_14290 [Balneolaceae bacterium]|nr:hypothetical protein [Balneolaceae bacterium]
MRLSKFIVFILSLVIVALFTDPIYADCKTGGVGASSCAYSKTEYIWFIIPITTETSVSCGSGYYACCTGESAMCNRNGTSEPDSGPNVRLASKAEESDEFNGIYTLLPAIRVFFLFRL